ncbi:hypothetical protein BKA93DRAFT_827864 [Sparassis latifolia]
MAAADLVSRLAVAQPSGVSQNPHQTVKQFSCARTDCAINGKITRYRVRLSLGPGEALTRSTNPRAAVEAPLAQRPTGVPPSNPAHTRAHAATTDRASESKSFIGPWKTSETSKRLPSVSVPVDANDSRLQVTSDGRFALQLALQPTHARIDGTTARARTPFPPINALSQLITNPIQIPHRPTCSPPYLFPRALLSADAPLPRASLPAGGLAIFLPITTFLPTLPVPTPILAKHPGPTAPPIQQSKVADSALVPPETGHILPQNGRDGLAVSERIRPGTPELLTCRVPADGPGGLAFFAA